jgi:hypothetical protein
VHGSFGRGATVDPVVDISLATDVLVAFRHRLSTKMIPSRMIGDHPGCSNKIDFIFEALMRSR